MYIRDRYICIYISKYAHRRQLCSHKTRTRMNSSERNAGMGGGVEGWGGGGRGGGGGRVEEEDLFVFNETKEGPRAPV